MDFLTIYATTKTTTHKYTQQSSASGSPV